MEHDIESFITYRIKQICVGDIRPDSNLFDHGLDSVNFVDLLVEVERRFGIFFDDEELDLRKLRSIRNIVAMMSEKLNKSRPQPCPTTTTAPDKPADTDLRSMP